MYCLRYCRSIDPIEAQPIAGASPRQRRDAAVSGKKYRQKMSHLFVLCALIASALSLCAVASFVSNWVPPPCDQKDVTYSYDDAYAACAQSYYSSFGYVVISTLGLVFCLASCVITALVRAHVRKRDSIPATVCEGADDYCCAGCCLPCTQCQLLRHELGRSSADRYRLLSSDGSADGAMLV